MCQFLYQTLNILCSRLCAWPWGQSDSLICSRFRTPAIFPMLSVKYRGPILCQALRQVQGTETQGLPEHQHRARHAARTGERPPAFCIRT